MKAIILAGGKGSRLYPITKGVNKHLLPVYDKSMIYYPLSVLMLAKIKDILIISSKEEIDRFKMLFSKGEDLGLNIEYAIQEKAGGIAEAFIIGEEFIKNDSVCLILGDNLIYGSGLQNLLIDIETKKATIFGYNVENPQDYGIVEIENNTISSIEEKPQNPKSNIAVIGLYFYPNDVIDKAKNLKPSKRGELEISDINNLYLKENRLDFKLLGRGYTWLDMGMVENLLEASNFISIVQKRQGLKIACIEEIAYNNGWVDKEILFKKAKEYPNEYGKYLLKVIEN